MSYHSFSSNGQPAYLAFYPGQSGYGPNAVSHSEEAIDLNMQSVIDPDLRMSSPAQYDMAWDPSQTHQMQQFIKAPATAFFAPAPQMHPLQTNFSHQHYQSAPLPPVSQGRHGSPFSQQLSSTSSGSLSPPTESDVLPSTPPDVTAMSPYLPYTQHHERLPLHSRIDFACMQPGNACVNPHDVNPQDMFDSVTNMELDRSLSFSSSTDTQYDGESHANASLNSTEFFPRHMSPEEDVQSPIKEEIHVRQPMPSIVTLYPDPEVDEDIPSELEINVKVQLDDDDTEWKPKTGGKKRTRGGSVKGQQPVGNKAVNSNQRKRARTDGNTIGVATSKTNASASSSSKGKFPCTDCKNQVTFGDENGLQKHVKQQHTRPFVCVFKYAGCASTFASKNEWKRHVVSQHLVLQYWLCTQGACAKVTTTSTSTSRRGSTSSSNTTAPSLPNGAIFNRKDLYTQHVRRMHVPPTVRKAIKQKKPTPEWDDHLKTLQDEAKRERCSLPTFMQCPAEDCTSEFTGTNAWDDRMEHVARHLDKAVDPNVEEPMVQFGGDDDITLTNWAASPEVCVVRRTAGGQWELRNPLRPDGSSSGSGSGSSSVSRKDAHGESSDVDAEGEDE